MKYSLAKVFLIKEDASNMIKRLPEDIGIKIEKGTFDPNAWTIEFVSLTGKQTDFNGQVDIIPSKTNPCLKANIVGFSMAPKGFGPLLYDIALELSGDRGLTADRSLVSPSAARIWQFYYSNRSDITKKLLDDVENPKTPDPNDDCSFVSTQNKEESLAEPLKYVYYKTGTPIIDQLKKMKKLVVDGEMTESYDKTKANISEQSDELEDLVFYHGTSQKFNPGDYILPPSETGEISEKGRKKNLDKVFFTLDKGSAKIYAGRATHSIGGEPHIYRIKPEGEITWINKTKGSTVLMSDKAKVIDEV